MKHKLFVSALALALMVGLSGCGSFWATTSIGPDYYLDDSYGMGYYYVDPGYTLNVPPPPPPGAPLYPTPPPNRPAGGPAWADRPGQGPAWADRPGNAPAQRPGNNAPGNNAPGNNAPAQRPTQSQRPATNGTPQQGGFRGEYNQ